MAWDKRPETKAEWKACAERVEIELENRGAKLSTAEEQIRNLEEQIDDLQIKVSCAEEDAREEAEEAERLQAELDRIRPNRTLCPNAIPRYELDMILGARKAARKRRA